MGRQNMYSLLGDVLDPIIEPDEIDFTDAARSPRR